MDTRGHGRESPVLVARRTFALLPADDADGRYPKQGGGSSLRFTRRTASDPDPIDVLTLSETIVPAMITPAAPIVAGDQIVFLLGNYRGDIWMMDLQY